MTRAILDPESDEVQRPLKAVAYDALLEQLEAGIDSIAERQRMGIRPTSEDFIAIIVASLAASRKAAAEAVPLALLGLL
jgi:hypothetical protein